MIRRPVEPIRVAAHADVALRWLQRFEKFSGLAPGRFDDQTDFDTAVMARAGLREYLEAVLSIGRHVLARRHSIAVTEYRQVAVELIRLQAIPVELRADFAKLAGLRNRLTHAYLEVAPSEVYEVVAHKLPLLCELLHALVIAAGLAPLPDGPGPGSALREKRVRYRATSRRVAPAKRKRVRR